MTNLHNAIFEEIKNNIEGMTREEAKYWIENDAICVTGSVNGLIYYYDTSAFFDEHEEEILDLAKDYEFTADPVELGMGGFKNCMAWFAFEALKDTVFEDYKDDFIFSDSEVANA